MPLPIFQARFEIPSPAMATAAQIAIIGAGLSGRLLALNLLRFAAPNASVGVRLIDRGDERYMGPAYSDGTDFLLLNVPAGRMGAVSEDPEQFLRWVRQRGIPADHLSFLPRTLYRDYLLDLLHEVRQQRLDGPLCEHARGEVTDIEPEGDRVRIHMDGGRSLVVDKAVLAVGNYPPRDPPVENRSGIESPRYVRNPWKPEILDALSRDETVLLIGTGQTTIDLVVTLRRRAHQGRIIAISRRGMLPLPHGSFDSYKSFASEIGQSTTIPDLVRIVRRHVARAASMGVGERAVIDSLRPDTQAIWTSLSEAEKHRFLRHVFRFWEVVRSRIPPESQATIDAMRASGQFDILRGRVVDMVDTGEAMDVHFIPRGCPTKKVERAAIVINSIGPESDYNRIDDVLVRNLMKRGLIRCGPAHIGIDALPDGTIIGRDGAPSGILYTLGSPMKGVLWEVLAVIEIRVQAERLARLLLAGT